MERSDTEAVETPDDLKDRPALLLGLWSMGITDRSEVCALLRTRRPATTVAFWKALVESELPKVRSWIQNGIPPGYYYELPFKRTVECPLCGRVIRFVPCHACTAKRLTRRPEADAGEPDPPLGEPTPARPGSLRKVQVLMLRLERGESLFHPLDAIGDTVSQNGQ